MVPDKIRYTDNPSPKRESNKIFFLCILARNLYIDARDVCLRESINNLLIYKLLHGFILGNFKAKNGITQ